MTKFNRIQLAVYAQRVKSALLGAHLYAFLRPPVGC